MRLICSKSSVAFECEFFPASLCSPEICHPIFYIPQRKLIPYLAKWGARELTDIDSYLLFLALLNSSELVTFRVPAKRTVFSASIIANNMESLAKTVTLLNAVKNPAVVFPQYVITPETQSLENVKYWIENWKSAYQDFLNGYRDANTSAKLIRREAALERLIRNPHKPVSSYAGPLAEWAAEAASFPESSTVSRFTSKACTIKEYWQEIIIKAASDIGVYQINNADLDELLEHVECNIPVGSVFSHALFQILRRARDKNKNFLGFGDPNISKQGFIILDQTDDVEAANIKAMIASAPETLPKPADYPTKIAYMKAKAKWDMAQRYGTETSGE